MDPVTLFAVASGAVKLVKEGCKLYKDIKGAAGDVKGVLVDLENQFHSKFRDRQPTTQERNQYVKERNRVIELNKKHGEIANIYQDIGNHLGTYYDNFYMCMAIFEEEERRSRTEVYTGDDSLGKRALQRVLMRKQLIHMETELREIMVYQCPVELGALHTEVEEMMKALGKDQKRVIAMKMRDTEIANRRKKAMQKKIIYDISMGLAILVICFSVVFIFMMVVEMRAERWPHLGNCFMPKGSWLYKEWTNFIWATCE